LLKLAQLALVVRDYDEAIAWYTQKLGFTLVEDTALGGEKRWVVVRPDVGAYVQSRAESSGTTSVTLEFESPADPEADSDQCTYCVGDPFGEQFCGVCDEGRHPAR
jgi:catechol 2,3-dioxygenase-like lactoylglutathione lyase family enzyme